MRLIAGVWLLIGLLMVLPVQASDVVRDQRLVLAFYYPWYNLGTWESGTTSDLPRQPYNSFDPAAIDRHANQAREAGIDVLVSAWFGPRDDNPTEHNFKLLLDKAQPRGLQAALLLETDSADFFPDRGSLVQALRHVLDVHAAHPAYLRVDGRPAIFVWNPSSIFGPNGARVNARGRAAVTAWSALLDEVDPERRAIWIAEGEYTPILEVFDGIFPYSIAWSPNPAGQLQTYAHQVRAWNAQTGSNDLWIATAMPGYDDTRIPGRGRTFAVDRADGAYYRTIFGGAIDSRPDWIMISSFNEWVEGSQIEPSQSYGSLYLDLTRELATLFKTAR